MEHAGAYPDDRGGAARLKLLDLLDGQKQADGTRSGGIKTNQQRMLVVRSGQIKSEISFLEWTELILLVLGIAGAVGIVMLMSRAMIKPIRELTGRHVRARRRQFRRGAAGPRPQGRGRRDRGRGRRLQGEGRREGAARGRRDVAPAEGRGRSRGAAQAKIAAEQAKAAEEQARKPPKSSSRRSASLGRWSRLASPRATCRSSSMHGFTDDYKQIRDDFNRAIGAAARRPSARSRPRPARSPAPPPRSRPPRPTSRSAPRSRPRASSRPRPRWSRSRRP